MNTLTIPENIDEMLKPHLLYFNKLQPFINDSSNDVLQISHKTVENRLSFANMHICLLNQVYNWNNSFERNFMKRALLDNIVLNLVGCLEASSHVINGIYSFNINFRDLIIDHRYPKNKERHKKLSKGCVRCRLNKVNIPLAKFLDRELKIDSPAKNWYAALREYRNQAVHRPHYIAHQIGGVDGYFIPDNPNIRKPKGKIRLDRKTSNFIFPNFTNMRELKSYAEEAFMYVMLTINITYGLIHDDDKIKNSLKTRLK